MSLSVIVSLNRSRNVYLQCLYPKKCCIPVLTKVQQCHLISDWMPSRWDISFKTERDLRHNPAQVAKNARFGNFDGCYLKANKYNKNGNHAPKTLICFWCHVRNVPKLPTNCANIDVFKNLRLSENGSPWQGQKSSN